MHKIKFSHSYKKLPKDGYSSAILLQVMPVKLENLNQEFLVYDTAYDGGFYQLPAKGDYLLLIFKTNGGTVFTTLRRSTPEKLKYYYNAQGQFFNIIKIET